MYKNDMSIPQLPQEMINKILYEFKGFQPYPFLKEFNDMMSLVKDPDDYEWDEAKGKSDEWIMSQFENEDSFYYEEWGNMSMSILDYIDSL